MVLSCSEADSAALLLLEFRPTDTCVVFITYSCYPGPRGGPEAMVPAVSSSDREEGGMAAAKKTSWGRRRARGGRRGGYRQMSFIANLTTPNANPWADPPVRSDPFAVRPHPRAEAKTGLSLIHI